MWFWRWESENYPAYDRIIRSSASRRQKTHTRTAGATSTTLRGHLDVAIHKRSADWRKTISMSSG
jgi:hypothetical protein